MTHQILGLRTFIDKETGEEKKYDAFFDKGWKAQSIEEILGEPEKVIEQIPKDKRWNIFYTLAHCGPDKREFNTLDVIAFDIDGMDLEKKESYINATCATLGVNRDLTGIVCSGNGLHFLVKLAKPIKKREYIKENRKHYRGTLARLNSEITKLGLPGKFDPTTWDGRRILRLPLTVNRKPGRDEKLCTVLQANISAQAFDLTKVSGLPVIGKTDSLPKNYLRQYPKTDSEAIFSDKGCSFMRQARDNPAGLDEPAWYAALSITARLEHGVEMSHTISKGHPGYSQEETDLKIEQALEASGPRTCSSIQGLWGKCKECPHFQKLNSPIQIMGENTIATEHSGFHKLSYSQNGNPKYTPAYLDLLKFYEREVGPFVGLDGSKIILVWNGTHYKPMPTLMFEAFAQEHFKPECTATMAREFRELVTRCKVKPMDWFEKTTRGKMNFLNGVLDLATMELEEPNPDYGFRYVLPYNYNPEAKAPTFDKMMDRITEGRGALRQILLEYMGYSLVNDECWTQKALVLVGDGANGKSTFLNIVQALIGEDNTSAMNLEDLKHEYNRQILDGKLVNLSEETPDKALLDTSLFKNLVAGGRIQVRSPYKEPYFVKNKAKLIFSCNELPDSTDGSYGFFRRLIVIPFDAVFTKDDPEYDPFIESKIIEELSGVFNQAMAGYRNLTKNWCFTSSQEVDNAVDAYHLSTDIIRDWLEDHVEVLAGTMEMFEAEGHWVVMNDIYAAFCMEMESKNEKPISHRKFWARMKRYIPGYAMRIKKRKVENKNTHCIHGIRYSRESLINESDKRDRFKHLSLVPRK